jgi:NAD+-dependent protein deacetylase sirtuin 4
MDRALRRLIELLLQSRNAVALTGAGCSTESGIPDYRGEGSRPRKSIQGPDFHRSAEVRRRYWARAAIGWSRFRASRPNGGHLALADLERQGKLSAIITQNVDGLHHAAGSGCVVELHGTLSKVECMQCKTIESRDAVQSRIVQSNPMWLDRAASMAPDGDADLHEIGSFIPPRCPVCEGDLRPGVVLFGENVPRAIVDSAGAHVDSADLLLVLGTSLAVFSGYRFLVRAHARGIPIAMVNLGPVRGDDRADVVVRDKTGVVLPEIVMAMGERRSREQT